MKDLRSGWKFSRLNLTTGGHKEPEILNLFSQHASCLQNLKKIHDIDFHGVAGLKKNDPDTEKVDHILESFVDVKSFSVIYQLSEIEANIQDVS